MTDTLFPTVEPERFDVEAYGERIHKHARLLQAKAERDAALAQVEDNADARWKLEAERIVIELARTGRHFTSDDVMDALDRLEVTTRDTRALGPVMLKAIRREWIHKTGYTASRRRHSTAIAEYVGMI